MDIPSVRKPNVVVIGAGIAGLTVAYRLQKGGMDVALYEARNRVGGRILTARVNGHLAELGGQNITDGGESLHLNHLIDEMELERASSRIYLDHGYFAKKKLTPIQEILIEQKLDPDALKRQLQELASRHSTLKEVLDELLNPDDPLYEIIAIRMEAYEGGPIEKLSSLYIETLFYMLLGGVSAVHQKTDEENSFVNLVTLKKGNASLTQKMGNELGSRLHLNMPLKRVSKKSDGLFSLTFQNNQVVQSQVLILAVPCSVFKQISFEGGIIPSQKLTDIQSIQYGNNAKILVPFLRAPKKVMGLVGNKVVSYFDRSQQLLTIYYTGNKSLFSKETIESAYQDVRPMIEEGYKKDCPTFQIPIYAKDEQNISYEGPVGYSWPNDPYARGTYCYISAGQEKFLNEMVEQKGERFKSLFAPIQNLYFVGEHASILSEVPGTIEAACESGERIARAILRNV